MSAHLMAGAASLDVKAAAGVARSILAAAMAARVWSDRSETDAIPREVRELDGPSQSETDLACMMSVVGAVRTNIDLLPQSLREFLV